MNRGIFIHVVLAAVLCFSPLAANVHLAGHFHALENDVNARSAHREFHQHQPSGTSHRDIHKSSGTDKDCSIYHVYLSLSGCLSVTAPELTESMQNIGNSVIKSTHVTFHTLDDRHIRGPPSLS